MSRHYSMDMKIVGVNPERIKAIKQAANAEWNFEDWHTGITPKKCKAMTARGESSLCGGEDKEEFTDRLARAIWKANGGYCKVIVCATYLEDLPYERHERGRDHYDLWRAAFGTKTGEPPAADQVQPSTT